MFYSFTNNHYITPLHPCLMAKICNHTGIKRCGLEKDHQNTKLFLDDCDMFEYNCDYKKAYSEVDDKLCKEDVTESNTTLQTTSMQTQTDPEIITVPTKSITTVSGITNAKCTCMDLQTIPGSNTTIQTITDSVSNLTQTKGCTCSSPSVKTYEPTNKTQAESATITIPTTPLTPVSGNTTSKCTCTDLQTTSVSNTESTTTSTQIKHECTCTQPHSEPPSMRTAVDNTTETTSNTLQTTDVSRDSESPNATESTTGISYANVTRIPIAFECTRGKNSTSIVTSEKQNTDSVNKSSETVSYSTDTVITGETKIPTSLTNLETNSSTLTNLETVVSTLSPITKTTKNMETLTTSAQKNSCTCNSVSFETVTTQTELNSEIITTPTTPMTPVSEITAEKCTCMDLQTIPKTTTKSLITSNNPYKLSLKTTIDDSLQKTLTKVEYEDTTLKHSCDKYPKHCKRPLTWETTARGETRDFFQILRERFGDRVKILRDTTHWPQRMAKTVENDNDGFHFGTHNDI